MRLLAKAISGVVLLFALVLTGCGRAGTTAANNAVLPQHTVIPFRSTAFLGESLPAQYTCDGKNVAPPLEWGTVPRGTSELLILAIGLTPTSTTGSYRASVDWAVAGLNPALRRLTTGRLPQGAHLGIASDGKRRYSICPKKGANEQYQFVLYAMPSAFKIPQNFVGLSILAKFATPDTPTSAIGQGTFVARYKRR